MARLGTVLGGVLAELVRARVTADRLTKDLVAEYEGDPILAAFAVPRMAMRDVELALRFNVTNVDEVEAAKPNASALVNDWQQFSNKGLREGLEGANLTAQEAQAVVNAVTESGQPLVAKPTVTEMRKALSGDPALVAKKSTAASASVYTKLPKQIKDKVGTKAAFEQQLNTSMQKVVDDFINRSVERENVKAALASMVEVSVAQKDLSDDPAQVHEIRLTLKAEDLDLVVSDAPQ